MGQADQVLSGQVPWIWFERRVPAPPLTLPSCALYSAPSLLTWAGSRMGCVSRVWAHLGPGEMGGCHCLGLGTRGRVMQPCPPHLQPSCFQRAAPDQVEEQRQKCWISKGLLRGSVEGHLSRGNSRSKGPEAACGPTWGGLGEMGEAMQAPTLGTGAGLRHTSPPGGSLWSQAEASLGGCQSLRPLCLPHLLCALRPLPT